MQRDIGNGERYGTSGYCHYWNRTGRCVGGDYRKNENKSVLLIPAAGELSEKMSKAHQILNYPGLPEVWSRSGCRVQEAVSRSWHRGDGEARERGLCDGRLFWDPGVRQRFLKASTVILAAGIVMGKPFPGENKLLGSGVSYCATCDAQFFRRKGSCGDRIRQGGGQEADYLAEIVGKVHYFPMGKRGAAAVGCRRGCA